MSVADKTESGDFPLNVDSLLKIMRSVLPEDSLILADGGFSVHWSSLYYDVLQDGRYFLVNHGLAAIG